MNDSNDFQRLVQEWADGSGHVLVYLVTAGSHAYGLATEGSDRDLRGVFVPPWGSLIGLDNLDRIALEPDIEMKSIREFVRLCEEANPNMLDWLFVPDDCVHVCTTIFQKCIRDNREQFLSKRLYHRFRGYAHSHLQKMQRGVTGELGAKRKANIEQFGYSTKNAMHLIRLARMGCEVLETGRYNVRRDDREELLAIKAGEWSLDRVKEEGSRLLVRLDMARASSPLPDEPQTAAINAHLVQATLGTKRYIG